MAGNRRDYEIKVKGKRVFEVFFYHSSGKECHISVFGTGRYEKNVIFDARFDAPTSFDLATIDSLSSDLLLGNSGSYGYSYYGGYGSVEYTQGEARDFLLEASDRLSEEKKGTYYFSHYGREILSLYFKYPRLFPQLGLDIMEYAKFFYPESLHKDEEYSLFRETQANLPFGVSFFLLSASNGNVSYDFATELFASRRTFIDTLRKKIERMAGEKENEDLLIQLGSHFPFINSNKANAILLEHNHGLGIDFNALFPFLDKKEAYEDIAFCLLSSPHYIDILANSVDSPYLYYLSILDSHGYKEEAKNIAKKICKVTENPLIYKYLSSYFSKQEKQMLAQSNEVTHFPYANYSSGSFSFFQADIDPEDIEEHASSSKKAPLYGAGILPIGGLDKDQTSEIKKDIRSSVKAIRLNRVPEGRDEATLIASALFGDAPSYKAIFEDNADPSSPLLHLYKAKWKKENAKKAPEVKPYSLNPNEGE